MNWESISCDLCGSKSLDILLKDVTTWEHKGRFTYVKCRNCGLVFLNPRPSIQGIIKYYPPEAYWGDKDIRKSNRVVMDEKWRKKAIEKIKQITQAVAASMNTTCNVKILGGYPVLRNDPEVTTRSINYATDFLGKDQVAKLDPRMTAEDFAFYAELVPSTFYRLGTAYPKKKLSSGLHTSDFDIDESALKTGMGLMAYLAISHLQ